MIKGVKFRLGDNSKFSIKDNNREIMDVFPSHSLFSALINNINKTYGDIGADRTIEMFNNDEFAISSMFIGLDFYSKDKDEIKKTLYFLPKPETNIEKVILDDDKKLEENVIKRKVAKKIKMISLGALKEMGSTWDVKENKFNYNLFDLVSIGTSFACTKDEIKDIKIEDMDKLTFYDDTSSPHLEVDRISNRSKNFFYQDERSYRYEYTKEYRVEPFMYFMYSGELTMGLNAAINLIVDEGIGGRRTVGLGGFLSNEYIDIDLFDKENPKVFITLSSYIPLKEELDNLLGYKLERVSGYIYYKGGQPYRKRTIGLIREGAITKEIPRGKIVDVTPIHSDLPIQAYCNGKAFALGIGGGKDV